MKKLLAVLVCLGICLAFAGCQKPDKDVGNPTEQTEKPTENPSEALEKVLNKKASFTYKCLVFDKVTEENLEKFTFNTEGAALNPFRPIAYTYVDLDSDGVEELLVSDMGLHYYLILRYDNGKVNGYILERISPQEIKTDGSFVICWNNGPESVDRIWFDGLDYALTELACKDDGENTYALNGKLATKETVESYFADWKNSGEKITWTNIQQK